MRTYKYFAWMIPGIFLCFSTIAQVTESTEMSSEQRNTMNNSLTSQYSGIDTNSIKWTKSGEGYYEGSFRFENRDMRSTFDNNGSWLGTSERIGLNDLPKNVHDKVLGEYGVDGIQTVDRYTNSNDEIYYDVIPRGGQEPVRYDIEGNILRE